MGKWQAIRLFTIAPACRHVKRKLLPIVHEGRIAVVSDGKYKGAYFGEYDANSRSAK